MGAECDLSEMRRRREMRCACQTQEMPTHRPGRAGPTVLRPQLQNSASCPNSGRGESSNRAKDRSNRSNRSYAQWSVGPRTKMQICKTCDRSESDMKVGLLARIAKLAVRNGSLTLGYASTSGINVCAGAVQTSLPQWVFTMGKG